MLVHLDTSYLIGALVAGSPEDAQVRTWLRDGVDLGVSVIAWADFLCEPATADHAQRIRRLLGTPVALTEDDARQAASLFNRGGRRRGSLPDALIAATAMRSGAWLATRNRADFERYEDAGLRLVREQPPQPG